MEALATLGIDPLVMLAQAFNFFLLLAILTFFLYKPLLKVLDERKERIAKAEENAEKISKRLTQVETDVKTELHKAQATASEIMAAARHTAKELETRLVGEAQAKAQSVIDEGRVTLAREQEAAVARLHTEVSRLTMLATEKLLERELTAADKERLAKAAVADLSQLA